MEEVKPPFGSPIRVVLNAIAIFLISQLVATGLIIGLILWLHGGVGLIDQLNKSAGYQFIFIAIAEALAVGLVLWVLARRRIARPAIGLRNFQAQDLWQGVKGFVAFYILLIISSVILTIIFPGLNNTPQDVGFNNVAGIGEVLAFIGLIFLPPIGEEVLIRGYLFSGLRSRMNFFKAGLITSILFSAAHLQLGDGTAPVWGAAADTFVLSWVLVYLRENTGALYAGMLVHLLNNLVAFIVKFH